MLLTALMALLLAAVALQDGQMAYKQALAFIATGDAGHAETAQSIMEGWAAVNKVWGLQHENGPLGKPHEAVRGSTLL
jgi:hypothetical protein